MWWHRHLKDEQLRSKPDYFMVLSQILDAGHATELVVQGAGSLFLITSAGYKEGVSPFTSDEALLEFVHEVADASHVRLDPVIGSGGGVIAGLEQYRWHALLPPISQDGVVFSLRKHQFRELSLANFAGDQALKDSVSQLVQAKKSLLIAGPTSSGKSTLLFALLRQFASTERMITVETITELPKLTTTSLRLRARPADSDGIGEVKLEHLVREALRLTPDRIVVGEIRGDEAKAFAEALLSGHPGLISTIHAGSAQEARERLTLLASGSHDLARTAVIPAHVQNVAVAVLKRSDPPEIVEVSG